MAAFTAKIRPACSFGKARLPAAHPQDEFRPRSEAETRRILNTFRKLLVNWSITCCAGILTLIQPSSCWAATRELPWDQALLTLQNILIGPVAHAVIALAFVGAGLLYAVGCDKQAGRLAVSGIGGCLALVAIRLLNFVFP